MSADSKQVGGGHYKGVPEDIQHWNVVYALGWCYQVGAATKYLWRLGRKGDEAKKLEDVEKAIHYLEKKAEQLREELAAKTPPQVVFTAPSGVAMVDLGAPTRAYIDQD